MKTHVYLAPLIFFSTTALADIAVVVHPSNTNTMNKKVISRVFTGKVKVFPDDSRAIPINQTASSPPANEFNRKVLRKSASQLKAYWSKRLFTGKGRPPQEVSSDADMVELVASNPEFIGYVDADMVTDQVRVISTFK
ncbi:type 2 periplasmic-binding domain-containing protein [Marinagarivorans algicola]|uniref:phosphate ABC transporter substrate-binding protein n=1 Tax=Marinagarivorans algicola TaxID=1513270 RepID=UPI003735EEED